MNRFNCYKALYYVLYYYSFELAFGFFLFFKQITFFYQTQVQMLKKKLLDFPTANADLLTGAVKTEMVCSLNNSNP